MAEPSGEISIQPDLVADTQALAKELNISWSRVISLALKDFVRRHRSRQDLVDRINAAYSDTPDDQEMQLLQSMRSTHRHIVEGEW
jgi:hypothetical protein